MKTYVVSYYYNDDDDADDKYIKIDNVEARTEISCRNKFEKENKDCTIVDIREFKDYEDEYYEEDNENE